MEEINQQEGERFSEWAERAVTIIKDCAEKFVAAIRPYFNALYDVMQKFYDWIYSIYLKDGAPYGETPEGMQLWFEQGLRLYRESRQPGLDIYRQGLSPG